MFLIYIFIAKKVKKKKTIRMRNNKLTFLFPATEHFVYYVCLNWRCIKRLHFELWIFCCVDLLHLYVTKHTCLRYGREDQCALDVVVVLGMRKGPSTEYQQTGLAVSYIPTSREANCTESCRYYQNVDNIHFYLGTTQLPHNNYSLLKQNTTKTK